MIAAATQIVDFEATLEENLIQFSGETAEQSVQFDIALEDRTVQFEGEITQDAGLALDVGLEERVVQFQTEIEAPTEISLDVQLGGGPGVEENIYDTQSYVAQKDASYIYFAWARKDGAGYKAFRWAKGSVLDTEATNTGLLPMPADLTLLIYS